MFAVTIVGILSIPLFAFAATSGVASPPTSVAMPPVACYPFSRSLWVGVSGSDVLALQNYLAVQGYFNVAPTGYFGMITKAAVGQWQAQNNVAVLGSAGNGIFGPLSRGAFGRLCGGSGGNNGNGGGGQGGNGGGQNPGGGITSSTQTAASFSATPSSGIAPLAVQFVATAPQGVTLGNAVNFGDGTQGGLGFVPVCSSCNAEGVVSHTYTSAGTYTATLTSGSCACAEYVLPDGNPSVCNCPAIQILATTTVVVSSASSSSSGGSTGPVGTSSIQQLDSPGSVTLSPGGIAEIRNENSYFTLESITSSSATIQITPVGCWNSFPSDPPPRFVCMIATVPIPPQTLTLGQAYTSGNYSITLTQLTSSTATFTVQ